MKSGTRLKWWLIVFLLSVPGLPVRGDAPVRAVADVLAGTERLEPLKAVAIAQHGQVVAARGYRGHSVDSPTNIKSASKTILATLVGIAIERGVLESVDQPIAPLLASDLPEHPDPRMTRITVGHLMSMQSGLARTSGTNYGPWILTRNWVRSALAQPFVDEPGGTMLYSTGSSHLLSAILTHVSGLPTRQLANEWLAPLEGFYIQDWLKDPQGIYLGGNQMAMSTRSLLAFGELYRNCGRSPAGQQVVSPTWVEEAWRPRTQSRFSGDAYGYGWFLRRIGGEDVAYAWGYGGQMLYVAPRLGVTAAFTSNDDVPAGRTGHRDALHHLMAGVLDALRPSGEAATARTASADAAARNGISLAATHCAPDQRLPSQASR